MVCSSAVYTKTWNTGDKSVSVHVSIIYKAYEACAPERLCLLTVEGIRDILPWPKKRNKKKESQQMPLEDTREERVQAPTRPMETMSDMRRCPYLSTARPTKGMMHADVVVAVAYKKEMVFWLQPNSVGQGRGYD